jgi:hypothetical protein
MARPRKPGNPVPNYFGDPLSVVTERFHSHITDFVTELKQHRGSVDIVDWISRNRWIKNKPWSWDNPGGKIDAGERDDPSPKRVLRKYLFDYLRDDSQEKGIIKPRQAEISETSINEAAFYICTRPGTAVSHIFPTDGMADGFSEEKIMPALTDSPPIQKVLMRSKIRRYLVHGGGIYTVTGAMKKAAGRSGSRDILFFDEIDFMPESIIPVFRDLISHSELKLTRYLSTPTVPGVGIDGIIQKGSMNEWVVVCPKCKREQIMKWPDNLMNMFEARAHELNDPSYEAKLNKVYIGCVYCGTPIDRNSVHYEENSQWIAQKPNMIGTRSTYYLTSFMLPWKTGKELARNYHLLQNYVWQFYNDVIGIAYIKGSNRLSDADIRPCQRPWSMPMMRTSQMTSVSVGVDWGETESWCVVSAGGYDSDPGKRCIVYAERIIAERLVANGISPTMPAAHAERVYQIAVKFGAQIIVNDANGIGVDKHKHLLAKMPGRVWGAFFDTADMGRQMTHDTRMIMPQWAESQSRVTFSKLILVKEIQNEYRSMQVALPSESPDTAEDIGFFIQHAKNLGIQPRWSMESEREYEIVTKFGDDHFFDAGMYSYIGYHKLRGTYTSGKNFVSFGGGK